MSALGLFNFVVLQWFCVRLGRVFRTEHYDMRADHVSMMSDGTCSLAMTARTRRVPHGWTLIRWVWPLTGWWSDYRWISKS